MSTGRSCKYCKRPYLVSDEVFAENPFCSKCLHERISITAFAHVNEQLAELARVGHRLIDADERGQGLPWQEAMKDLEKMLATLDAAAGGEASADEKGGGA